MFEQSVLLNDPTNTRWGLFISLTGELAILSVAALIPLAYTDRLPHFEWKVATIGPLVRHEIPPVKAQAKSAAVRVENSRAVFPVPPRHLPDLRNLPPDPPAIDAPPSLTTQLVDQIGAGGPFIPGQVPIENPPPPPVLPKPEPQRSMAGPIRVSMGVQMARLTRQVKPEYPFLAKQTRTSGVVHLVCVIGKDGTVQNLQVISGHPLLTRAALEAVRLWIYKPTLLNGEPVEVTAPIDVNFTLTQ